MSKTVHTSVLLNEILEGVSLGKGSTVLDATAGGGGHAKAILEKFPHTKLIAIDQDAKALDRVRDVLSSYGDRVTYALGNFRDLAEILQKSGTTEVDAILFDLGLSSDQLEQSGRGFSFMRNEPLLMTMKENPGKEDLTAKDIVNDWAEDSIFQILRGYGEERYAKKIAKAIADARGRKDIETTDDLVEIIRNAVPKGYGRGKINPATKTFQALRIAVNDELGALGSGLRAGFEVLKKGGRMLVISFHSLEDRAVKNFFRTYHKEGVAKLINKKPLVATKEEINKNPRSRSAKLRILEKI